MARREEFRDVHHFSDDCHVALSKNVLKDLKMNLLLLS